MTAKKAKPKIDTGVPVPAPKRPVPPETKYPWPDMKRGDSVLFGTQEGKAAYESARKWGQSRGIRFTRRLTTQGLRIWRV